MMSSKIKFLFLFKRIFAKLFLISFYILSIFLVIHFKHFWINPIYNTIFKRFINDNFFRNENMICDKFDPIFLMGERFKKKPIILCNDKESKHICYHNSKYN